MASLVASFSVLVPNSTGTTSAPSRPMRSTLGRWRRMSSAPMKTVHSSPKRAHTVALATPCWPAPVSATIRVFPSRRASTACPSALFSLCAPVWRRSSRFRYSRFPGANRSARVSGVGRPANVCPSVSSSTRNESSACASRHPASSSSSAGTSVSGTYLPPYVPCSPVDEDGDAQPIVGNGEHLRRAPRTLLGKDETEHVGAGLDGGVHVVAAREPADFDERARQDLAQLRSGIVGAHERRADEDRVRSCELGCRALSARRHAALGDDDSRMSLHAGDEVELRGAIDLEGVEVARVHADHLCVQAHRALELVRVVRLDERFEPELARVRQQRRGALVVDLAQQDKGRIRAGELHLEEIELFGEESLCQQRRGCRRPRGLQIVERAPEALVDEHGDRGRARIRELCGQPGRIRVGTQVARRGRAPLHFRDRGETGCGKSVAEAAHQATRVWREKATSRSSRSAAAPESIVSRASSSPSRRSAACPAAAIAPAALRRTAFRRPPSWPANTSRIACAFSSGDPPRSSSTLHRGTPSSDSGSSSRSRTAPSTTSPTRFGPTGDSSSMPPAPCTTKARLAPSRASTSDSVRTRL